MHKSVPTPKPRRKEARLHKNKTTNLGYTFFPRKVEEYCHRPPLSPPPGWIIADIHGLFFCGGFRGILGILRKRCTWTIYFRKSSLRQRVSFEHNLIYFWLVCVRTWRTVWRLDLHLYFHIVWNTIECWSNGTINSLCVFACVCVNPSRGKMEIFALKLRSFIAETHFFFITYQNVFRKKR